MVILVTGCRSGFGKRIAIDAAKKGHVVYAGLRDVETAQSLIRESVGLRVIPVQLDVTVQGERHAVVSRIIKEEGRLDGLVNNAGVGGGGPVEETKEEVFDQVMDINLKGVYFMTKYAAPHLRESGGNIINVASVMGIVGAPYGSIYGASKAAVMSLTRSHALEFGSAIRVNSVVPGGVDTDMLRGLAKKIAKDVESGYEILSKDTAAQHRIADASEIAGPVLYLASDLASFVTGSTHVVDGGEVVD